MVCKGDGFAASDGGAFEGSQNVLAVGLGNCVTLWSAHNSKVQVVGKGV